MKRVFAIACGIGLCCCSDSPLPDHLRPPLADASPMRDTGMEADAATLPDAESDAHVPDADAAPAPVDAQVPSTTTDSVVDRLRGLTSDETLWLSEVGLYADVATERLEPDVVEYTPRFALWTDGATKRRFLRLPPDTAVDSSDLDHFQLPVGGLLFKEFTRDGVRVETRLIARLGPSEDAYFMGSFLWKDDLSDARLVRGGRQNARSTPHDVPAQRDCGTCHNGEPGRILGFSAVQLHDASPVSLAELVARGLISDGPPAGAEPQPRASGTVLDALGYLHANCGHCHNPNGSARPDTDLDLRLPARPMDPEETPAYVSSINVPLQSFVGTGLATRVVPGQPGQSALLLRMLNREPRAQMPPIATEVVDDSHAQTIHRWIRGL